MSTASSPLQPPPVPARAAFVDPTTGVLTNIGFWFLYQLFKASTQSQDVPILEMLDSGAEAAFSLTPRIDDLEKLWALEQETQQVTVAPTPSGATLFQYETISGATVISPMVVPAPADTLLVVCLTFAAAVQPTWSSGFSLVPGAISTLIGTRTNILFGSDQSGKWMMIAPPVTGR